MSTIDLLPNDQLIAMTTRGRDVEHPDREEVLGYAYAVAGDGGDEEDQVQRWILFSRDRADRPPRCAPVSLRPAKDVDVEGSYRFERYKDFSGVDSLDAFIRRVTEIFRDEPVQPGDPFKRDCYYVKVNCLSSNPVKNGATGAYVIAQPFDQRRPRRLAPTPSHPSQADTGTRWLFTSKGLAGVMYAQMLDEHYSYEWWLLRKGFDPGDASYDLEIRDLDSVDTERDIFLNNLSTPLDREDTLVAAACVYHSKMPSSDP